MLNEQLMMKKSFIDNCSLIIIHCLFRTPVENLLIIDFMGEVLNFWQNRSLKTKCYNGRV